MFCPFTRSDQNKIIPLFYVVTEVTVSYVFTIEYHVPLYIFASEVASLLKNIAIISREIIFVF
jgi:hypothetical protein